MVESGFGGTSLLDPEKILRNELQLGAKSRVADLGCGTMGYFTLAAARLVGREGLVYAIDVLKDVLSSVASRASLENLDNVKTVWSNLEIPEATQIPVKVDAVLLVTVLFQNNDHSAVIKEALCLLKDGGRLLVVEWLPQATTLGPAATRRIRPEVIKDYAKQLDLKLTKEFAAGPYHYGLIFSK